MSGGRTRHFAKTYNYPYLDLFSKLPEQISSKLQEQWTNIHYKRNSWRFWVFLVNRSPKWYVVEVPLYNTPKREFTIELQCYDSDCNQVYKWNDKTRYNIEEYSSMRGLKSLHCSKGARTMSFPELLNYYRHTIYDRTRFNIIPKPDPPDPPDAQDPRRSATTIRL